jgi:hypothetical protein
MAERPQRFVREAAVVPVDLLGGEKHAPQVVGGAFGRHGDDAVRSRGLEVRAARSMRDPCASARAQQGLDSGDEPARRAAHDDARVCVFVLVRLPVRDDHQRRIQLVREAAQAVGAGGGVAR